MVVVAFPSNFGGKKAGASRKQCADKSERLPPNLYAAENESFMHNGKGGRISGVIRQESVALLFK